MFKYFVVLKKRIREWLDEWKFRRIQRAWARHRDDTLAYWGVEDESQLPRDYWG